MQPGSVTVRRAATGVPLLAALLILGLMPSAALGAVLPGEGHLSPRLLELAKPSVRSLSHRRQARVLGLPRSGPGSLRRGGAGVLVEVRFDRGASASLAALRGAGAGVVGLNSRYQTVTAAVPPADLRAVAALPQVSSVREVLTPLAFATCPSGAVVSEGDEQLRAREAREQFEVGGKKIDGSGVTVGILSDSFDQAEFAADGSGEIATHAKEDVETGDLPGEASPCANKTNVKVIEKFVPMPGGLTGKEREEEEERELAELGDEGRGMSQIVHDLAPGAALQFASAFNGESLFAKNIEKLANEGSEVIADDVAYLNEPFFQEGRVGVAASKATGEGVTYFSAAGNDNLIDASGRQIGSFEAPAFRDSGACPAGISKFEKELEEFLGEPVPLHPNHCMDFEPGSGTDTTYGITVPAGGTLLIDLQWAEPWEGVGTDLDAFLLEGGAVVSASGENNVGETQEPFELLGYENPSSTSAQQVELVINKFSGGNPRLKFDLLPSGPGTYSVEYPESRGGDVVGPDIFGHSGGSNVVSVAAVPFTSESEPEEYSSRGPVTHYFGPVKEAKKGPAAPLGSPQVLSKPDVAASDCVVTTFFAVFVKTESTWRFCGTSAAAPHAAAVAALALQKQPLASPAQIAQAEIDSARAVGTFGSCAVGGGLLDAVGTIEALESPESFAAPAPCTAPESPPIPEPPVATPSSVPPPPPAPNTFIRKHPKAVVRTRKPKVKLVFKFASDEAGVQFQCKVDKGRFASCPANFAKKFKPGKHVIQVRALGSDGQIDATPASFRFRVKLIS